MKFGVRTTPKAEDPVADLLLRNEAVEDFKQSIDDCLAERVGAFRDPAIIAPASSHSKIAALFSYDGGGAFDRPLREIGAAFDRDGFHGFIFPWTALAVDQCEAELCPLLNASVNEANPLCAVEKIFYGGWRPSRPAAGRPLMEPFKLGGDLSNRQVWI